MMVHTIEELIAEIRRNLPHSHTIKQFKPDNAGSYVSFDWNGRTFIVKKTFETFELKNQQLFITGASMLMQSALASQTKHHRILETCADALRQAEDLLMRKRQTEGSIRLLESVRQTISKLARGRQGVTA